MDKNEALIKFCLRLGDNSLIAGHRLAELCSRGPFLEEDIAMSNIGLDHIGYAEALLEYAGGLMKDSKTADELAYKRPEHEFLNALLVELPNTNFAHTVIKEFFFAAWQVELCKVMSVSPDDTIAGLAQKVIKEAKYHLSHTGSWVLRLAGGTEESHQKITEAIEIIWDFTSELFDLDEVENTLVKEGVLSDLSSLRNSWLEIIKQWFDKAGLEVPEEGYQEKGGRNGKHTEYLGHILSEMQYLPRAYSDAKW